MRKNINMVDLFSGIGGFAKGFEDAGFIIENHFFSEIDKHAIANYKYNFKNAKHIGSVTDIPNGSIRGIDLITFGSPCQDFSLAGKRKGLEGERSSLIGEAIRLISDIRPSVFIWENVKGAFSSNSGADFWAILQAFTNIGGYRLEWQLLNTKWFLPQNRERIYLIGHLAKNERGFKGVFPIEENDQLSNLKSEPNQGQSQTKDCATTLTGVLRATDTYIGVPKYSRTLTGGGNSGGLHSDMQTIQCVDLKVIKSSTRKGMFKDNETHTLDCCAYLAVGALRGRNPESPKSRQPVVEIDNILRRLTEIECERLQGFPDKWTLHGDYNGIIKEIPKSQRYKLLGNAVSKPVVEEIARRLLNS